MNIKAILASLILGSSSIAMASPAAPGAAGFACEDTLALASETIGFTAPEGGGAG